MKKRVIIASLCMLLSLIAFAAADKLDAATTKDTFVAGENISLKVSLLDSNNNPINANVVISVEDAEKRFLVEKTIPSNQIVDINLGEDAPAGYWKITAKYEGTESTSLFMVETSELARFELDNNVLTVINTGNTRYIKTIQIVIGDTIGSKDIDLGVGERTSFRLVAPEGSYNIRITDGKTTLTRAGVSLTGKVIGVLDNRDVSSSPVTAGVKGEEAPYGDEPAANRSKTFVYIFLIALLAAAALLALERRFRKSALNNNS